MALYPRLLRRHGHQFRNILDDDHPIQEGELLKALQETIASDTTGFVDLERFRQIARFRKSAPHLSESSSSDSIKSHTGSHLTFHQEFRGNHDDVLLATLDAYYAESEQHQSVEGRPLYSLSAPFIQSSCMGKSRTAYEVTKKRFGFNICLREPVSVEVGDLAHAAKAYPPPDDQVRDFLTMSGSLSSEKGKDNFKQVHVMIRYSLFMAELFATTKETLQLTEFQNYRRNSGNKPLATAWADWFEHDIKSPLEHGPTRRAFYDSVVQRARTKLTTATQSEAESHCLSSAKKLVKLVKADYTNPRKSQHGGKLRVEIVIFFDEAHTISAVDVDPGCSGLLIMERTFEIIREQPIFGIFMSTNSRLRSLAMPALQHPSMRNGQEFRLIPPLTEFVGFDLFAPQTIENLFAQGVTIEKLCDPALLMGFGRPYWFSRWNDLKEEKKDEDVDRSEDLEEEAEEEAPHRAVPRKRVRSVDAAGARNKLRKLEPEMAQGNDDVVEENDEENGNVVEANQPPLKPTTKDQDSLNTIVDFACRKLSPATNPTLAARTGWLALRLCLEPDITRAQGREFQSTLVESHMSVVMSIPEHRLFMHTGSPSEPVLVEAAGRLMEKHKVPIFQELKECIGDGLIAKGERGEVVARALMVYAHDRVARNMGPINGLRYCRPIRLLDFLKELLTVEAFDVVKTGCVVSGDDQDNDPKTFETVFKDAWINFSHFVLAGDSEVLRVENLCDFIFRGSGVQCNQSGLNSVAPTLFARTITSVITTRDRGALQLQIKNAKTEKKKLIVPTHHTQKATGDAGRPTFTLLLELGVATPSEDAQMASQTTRSTRSASQSAQSSHYQLTLRGLEAFRLTATEKVDAAALLDMTAAMEAFPRLNTKENIELLRQIKPNFQNATNSWGLTTVGAKAWSDVDQ
ncbi:hypothetical protein DXG03_001047 [Asterophora parasitica]|uniref:Uncharacterized protein n=1 Tax=Asterophora parasitica TaxID=117018 RepID=A0A9P7KAH8_9AGAR|nr:hypothetical protein DXG03_001047 [Asterophora parasitica]